MKKTIISSVLVLVLMVSIFAFVACNEIVIDDKPQTEADNITIQDMIGRQVTIDRNSINRIVCVGAGALRVYSYIGDMNKIVGAEDIDRNPTDAERASLGATGFKDIARPYYDYNKEYLQTLPTVGLGGPRNQAAEKEKIILVEPDLIISDYEDVEKENILQEATGTPVVTIKYGSNHNIFDETLYNTFAMLGKILKREERAAELVQYLKDCEAELQEKSAGIDEATKKSFYIGCLGNWGTQDILSTSKNFASFNVSGIKHALESSATLVDGNITMEKLVDINPDVIILDAAGINVFKTKSWTTQKSTILSLDAVINGEVYLQMPFNAYYTNIDVALMDAYFVASIAYPERYEGFNLEAKYTQILRKFVGPNADYSLVSSQLTSRGGYQRITNLAEFMGA